MILNKGTYGYRNAHRIRNILILLVIAAVIAVSALPPTRKSRTLSTTCTIS